MSDQYSTPEGFQLWRPLMFPDVRNLGDLLTVEGAWDFATMNHHNGYPQAATPREIRRAGYQKTVSRFCSTRNLRDVPHLVVTPTELLLSAVYPGGRSSFFNLEPFAFFDRIGFELIYHESNDRVLLTASASGIIATRYLAYIPLSGIPSVERAA